MAVRTIKDFVDMDWNIINNMKTDEARKLLDRFAEIANRRLDKLASLEAPVPALYRRAIKDKDSRIMFDESTGKYMYEEFSTEDRTLGGMKHDLRYLQQFFKFKTADVNEAKRYVYQMHNRLAGEEKYKSYADFKGKTEFTKEQLRNMWSAYNKTVEVYPTIPAKVSGKEAVSGEIINRIYEYMVDNNRTRIMERTALRLAKEILDDQADARSKYDFSNFNFDEDS